MNSSETAGGQSLAQAEWTPGRLLKALAELANVTGGDLAAERFLANWPGFFPLPGGGRAVSIKAEPEFFRAMPPGAASAPADSPGSKDAEFVMTLGDNIRRIWRGGPDSGRLLTALLLVPDPHDALLSAAKPDLPIFETMKRDDVLGAVRADWRRGRFAYTPKTPLQTALHLLMQKSALAKVCGNPDCPAPYFVADRATRKYCSPDCLRPFQLEWRRAWWEKHGEQRRAGKTKKKSRKDRGREA